ncbi:hypothetical protein [Absidia glauca]|uniref:Uncharacterized protein n=1 Tax=Absidia glauca TaxID=4829 RepID=A0A163MXV3_ABSGL|nr:hypothetical protein [Absidia glauca]
MSSTNDSHIPFSLFPPLTATYPITLPTSIPLLPRSIGKYLRSLQDVTTNILDEWNSLNLTHGGINRRTAAFTWSVLWLAIHTGF